MKTIQVELFKFHELSAEARQVAIENYRSDNSANESMAWQGEFNASRKAFLAVFGLDGGRYTSLPSETDELTGVRLATYIWNNYVPELEEKRVTFLKPVGSKNNKKRYSNIFVSRNCVLTGVCYDNYFADGIWEFLKKPCPHTTLEELIESCVDEANRLREDDVDEAYSNDELVAQGLEAADFDFYANGKVAEIHDYEEVA